ncbi:hypothetical protein NMY22_g2738 [Coprinellus aureogranulatus]|nr:hypothetical protein NMY22_g2738 [Coprinellus aureogranulatus]
MDPYPTAHLNEEIVRQQQEAKTNLTWDFPVHGWNSPLPPLAEPSSALRLSGHHCLRGLRPSLVQVAEVHKRCFGDGEEEAQANGTGPPTSAGLRPTAGQIWMLIPKLTTTPAHMHLERSTSSAIQDTASTPLARRTRAPKQKSALVLQKEHRCRVVANELMATTGITVSSLVTDTHIPSYARTHPDMAPLQASGFGSPAAGASSFSQAWVHHRASFRPPWLPGSLWSHGRVHERPLPPLPLNSADLRTYSPPGASQPTLPPQLKVHPKRSLTRCCPRRTAPGSELPEKRCDVLLHGAQHQRPTLSSFSSWRRGLSTSATLFQQTSAAAAPRPPQESTPPPEGDSEPTISPSRQALAAAKAIRLSVGSGNLPDAYLILNSVYYAKRDKSSLLHGIARLLPQNAFKPSPIPFSEATPTRLVTHTLLHSLVKNGYRVEASRVMGELMKNNIPVAKPSFKCVYGALTNPRLNAAERPVPTRYFSKVNILKSTLTEDLVASEGSKHALRLLNVARESRQKRTLNLYHALIRLCIINGEIILASLVFGLLVRDWNACVVDQDAIDATAPTPQSEGSKKLVIEKSYRHNRPTPFPEEFTLDAILHGIEDTLKVQNPRAHEYQEGAIQALANLAALLDHRQLAVGPSPLIYLLSRINLKRGKRGKQKVWVPIDGEMCEVDVEEYFNDVLTRLCTNPPSIAYPRSSLVAPVTRNGGYMPALDTTGYKHLAFFALVKQKSYELAKSLVDHMRLARSSPLKVDALMIERFKQAAVATEDERFLKASEFLATSNMTDPLPTFDTPQPNLSDVELARQVLSTAIESGSIEQIRLHIDSLVRNEQRVLADVVHDFLPQLIPGYDWRNLDKDVEGHFSRNGMKSLGEWDDESKQKQFEEDVRKAVVNGPKLITSILTALHRSARYQSADRVWVWAKQMEKESWSLTEDDYASNVDLRPWTLPIAAYNVMLQIRAWQTRVALKEPRFDENEKERQVKVIRRSAMRIYDQAMRARRVYGPLMKEAEEKGIGVHKDQELAIPDAVFFNTILDVVRPNSATSRGLPPPASVRSAVQKMEDVLQFYIRRRESPYPIDKALLRVGRDMLEHRYPLPWGLRYLFVGNGLDPSQNDVSLEVWGNETLRLSSAWRKRAVL